MPAVCTNGLDIYYEIHGDGPRLLVCGGSGTNTVRSRPLIDSLAKHFQVAVHDQRGLGRTGLPPTQPAMADYASDALDVLDDLGWTSARVYGISFGGMVAQELAVTAPDRVDRLALLCTSPGGAGGSSYPIHEFAEMTPDERRRVAMLIVDTRFTAEWLESHPGDRQIAELMAVPDTDRPEDAARGEAMQLEARRHHDVSDRLHRITCPTIVACGRYDGVAPPANSEAIASRIAGAVLKYYEGGHLFQLQDPRARPDIIEFLLANE